MPSPNDLVLITGVTGFIGSSTLPQLLRAGYRVRATVRSESQIETVLGRPAMQALKAGARLLSFAVVPDMTARGAFDEAVRGVTHVIHIASPLASSGRAVPADQHEAHYIQPAVRGTLNMLEAADAEGSVRRVVITSSFVALVPLAELEGTRRRDGRRPVRPDDRPGLAAGPYGTDFAAYAASKAAALQQAEAWMERVRPGFDVVHLHPGFVLGRDETATTPARAMRGTNSVVMALLLGKRFGPFAGATVHVEDVARAHVAALRPAVYGNQSYILSRPARWNDAVEIAERAFPDAMQSRLLVRGGSVGTIPLPMDTSLTEATFRFRLAGFRKQVESIVGQFVELASSRAGTDRGGGGSSSGKGAVAAATAPPLP